MTRNPAGEQTNFSVAISREASRELGLPLPGLDGRVVDLAIPLPGGEMALTPKERAALGANSPRRIVLVGESGKLPQSLEQSKRERKGRSSDLVISTRTLRQMAAQGRPNDGRTTAGTIAEVYESINSLPEPDRGSAIVMAGIARTLSARLEPSLHRASKPRFGQGSAKRRTERIVRARKLSWALVGEVMPKLMEAVIGSPQHSGPAR